MTTLDHPKHERFAQEYLVDLNATQAAIRAGYSAASAHVTGCRLLGNTEIGARIAALRAELEARTGVTIARVLEELAVIAFASATDVVVDAEGRLTPAIGAPASAVRAVASVKRTHRVEGNPKGEAVVGSIEIRYWDKVSALKAIGGHLGMFVKRLEVENTTPHAGGMTGLLTGFLGMAGNLWALGGPAERALLTQIRQAIPAGETKALELSASVEWPIP